MEIEIEWEEVEEISKELVNKKMRIPDGIKYLDEQIFKRADFYLLRNLKIKRIETEFNNWISIILNDQRIPSYIKSIYFGLFTMSDPRYNNGDEVTTIHMMGSSALPEEDNDWACEDADSFLPGSRYMVFTDFCLLDDLIQKNDLDGNFEVLIYCGILSLVLINNLEQFKTSLLIEPSSSIKESYKDFLNIGYGFDSGDTFLLGKMTSNGLV